MNPIKTRIYNCGGTGINIGTAYSLNKDAVCFLDSSSANLKHKSIAPESLYIIPNTNGAGGNQAYMMPHARKHAPMMIEKFEPGEQNIIVTSAGGGTGSTIALALLDELLAMGANVVVVAVGSYDATKRVRNTSNFIKNLEKRSLDFNTTIALAYVSNAGGEDAANQELLYVLSSLDALMDQENDRLDTQDVENFIKYHQITAVPPQLCALHILESRQQAAAVLEPISVAILVDDINKDVPYGTPFARTTGIVQRPDKIPGDQLHFVLNSVGISDIITELDDAMTKLTTTQAKFQQRRASFQQADLNGQDEFLD